MDRRIPIALLGLFFFCIFCSAETVANGKSQAKIASLPTIVFKDAVPVETRQYLGLSKQRNFSFKDIEGSLIVIELFSTYCMTCPKNVPIINDVYRAVEKDPKLKGRVKVIGIAIGNTAKEVESYKKAHNLLFPVLTDYDFSVHDILGNPRVPYTMFVKGSAGAKKIVDSHQGLLDSAEMVLKTVRGLNRQ